MLKAMPPPTPVPKITPKTVLAPLPAPSDASDTVKQSASLAILTGLLSIDSKSLSNALPIRQTEFAFLISPVRGEMIPGIPIPTVVLSGAPASVVMCIIRVTTA